MAGVSLHRGQNPLAVWREILDGASIRCPRPTAIIEPGTAAVAAIIARGEPVYGINTGFGKLASVHIAAGRPRGAPAQPGAVACGGRGRPDGAARRCG